MVRRFCDRTLWLDHGRVVQMGPPGEVLSAYSGAPSALV
jgi:ABC-type polysaccharide/polyol phosphate transport system ATPase subunit